MENHDIINFWFNELKPTQWWDKDRVLDAEITHRFKSIHSQAALGELNSWRQDAEGCLAEIIILDQFSRNIYRNKPESFAFDGMALVLAQEAIRRDLDKELDPIKQAFLYMPYMHSESLMIHEKSLNLFSNPGLENNMNFEIQHMDIIKKFGRYPHRNAILGRKSTFDELNFLKKHAGF